ncbi:MAG: hypothetical protein ABIW76_14000 [Fibrobacteria bacterium]
MPANPRHNKDLNMMNMQSKPVLRTGYPRRHAPLGHFQLLLRVDGHGMSLASDIGALEECLALERAAGKGWTVPGSEGIQSPQAVPYCEFLTARSADGVLQAVCRLMRIDRDNLLSHPLKAGRFHSSPLLTALRYSREGILEVGAPVFAPGGNPEKLAGLLWTGLIRFLERNGPGFILGQDMLAQPPEAAQDWSRLMDLHGLHPDLEVEARTAFPSGSCVPGTAAPARTNASPTEVTETGLGDGGEILKACPIGLREALRRGCRLACEPAYDTATGCLEFLWVASCDMLPGGETGDWRGAAPA